MSSLHDQQKTREQLLDELKALRDRLEHLEQDRGDADAARRRGEQLYRSLLESAPDAMVIAGRDGTIVLVNGQAEQMFGYRREELIGSPIEVLVPERFRAGHVAYRQEFTAHPRVRPMGAGRGLFGRHKDGREFPVEISLSPLQTEAGLLVMSAIRDVTQREQMLAELRKAEVRYRTLVEEIPAVTFMAPLDGSGAVGELYVSPQIEALLGFSQKEWLEDPVLWHRQLHPEDRTRWNLEFAPTVARAEPFSSVYRFVARDGRVVWVRGEARVVKDDAGRPLYLQGIAFDITAIKEAEEELKKLNQTLDERVKERTAEAERRAQELAQSNAKLEVFAYTASHDLKEPLRAIRMDTQRLQKLLAEQKEEFLKGLHDLKEPVRTMEEDAKQLLVEGQGDKIRESLAYIIESARLMQGLLEDLDSYFQAGQAGGVGPADCARVFESACNNLRAAIADSGASVTADPLPVVLGVKTELVRLFQNLINNAIKFRRPDRPAQVHVGARRQGDDWLFWVRDNGIGIRDKHLERIFGIGQKSRVYPRSKYPGTGFGLAICKQIVESRGGRIWVESQFDQGSTFYFTLPAVEKHGGAGAPGDGETGA
jgi:PAS domain S-box-containing protein